MASRVEIEEEKEGEHVETIDYYFERIGEPIPLKSGDAQFDLENPPSQALAVSELRQLVFVAHSSGFYVAKTKDVIDSAKELKVQGNGFSCSIEQISVVQVPIGRVRILTLSHDNSTLAVSVDADVHLFSVDSLLNEEVNPSLSSSLAESNFAKDIRWRRNKGNSLLVLSDSGKLYQGTAERPLKHVTDNVDAVEWSVKGTYIALAKESSLSILSSKFDERMSIALSCKSWSTGSDENCLVKVDSIRWVRPDCIILGLFQLTADGQENNYLIQIIRSQDGKLTDANSKTMLSFEDLFGGLVDDIVPAGSGPHLFLSYLEQYELAITANRKNTDQHIVLLSWSLGEEKGEAAVIDIDRDNFLPRIELQANGDDNLIMGLCIDKVSVCGKVKLPLGGDEWRELSPHCVLMCLTLEGKLNMFQFASTIENTVPPEVSELSDKEEEEEETLAVVTKECDQDALISGLEGNKLERVASSIPLHDQSKKEIDTNGSGAISDQDKITATENLKLASPEKGHSHEAVSRTAESKDKLISWEQGISSKELFSKNSFQGIDFAMTDYSKINGQKTGEHGFSSASLFGNTVNSTPSHSSHNELQKTVSLPRESVGKTGTSGLQTFPSQSRTDTSSQSLSSGNVKVLEDSNFRSSPLFSSHAQSSRTETSSFTTGVANAPSSIVGKLSPFSPLKDISGTSSSGNVLLRLAEREATRTSFGAGKIESVPSIRSSQLSSQLNFSFDKSQNQKHFHAKDDFRTPTQSGTVKEPHLSKQFNNIKELAKELDALLESIEGPGGFRDACTISQKSSLEALEQGMVSLSEKCGMWKGFLNEQLQETEQLLDKTVQVLARKIYMEGIVKQASDKRYWELWNRQKLSYELEHKRRHISKLNQDLTSQLIELERHFNTIELNKFGDSEGVQAGRRALHSKSGPSRGMQTLHSLHNTMTSQLVAAEHLSECLSKQMASLSVESPVKQQSVKKELFQTIGIPYDDSFSSPSVTKAGHSTSGKKLALYSSSSGSKDQSRRRQSGALKSFDPETARRRRDSLDQSWAQFEPPKTTIKRMVLQESLKKNVNKSPSLVKQNVPSYNKESSIAQKRVQGIPAASYQLGNKASIQDAVQTQSSESQSTPFRWANNSPGSSQSTGWKSPVQSSNSAFPMAGQNYSSFTLVKPVSVGSSPEKPNIASTNEKEIQSTQQSKPIRYQESSTGQMPSFSKKSFDFPNSNSKGTIPAFGGAKPVPTTTNHSSFDSSKYVDSQVSPAIAVSSSTSQPTKGLQFHVPASKSQPAEKSPPSSAFSLAASAPSSSIFGSSAILSNQFPRAASTSSFSKSVSAPSSSAVTSTVASPSLFSMSSVVPPSSSAMQFNNPATGLAGFIDAGQTVSSSSTSASPSPVVSSSSLFSFNPTKTSAPSPAPSPSVNSNPESSKADVQPPSNPSSLTSKPETSKTEGQSSVDTLTVKKFGDAALQALSPQPSSAGESSQKPESAVLSAPATETSTKLSSMSQSSFSVLSSPAFKTPTQSAPGSQQSFSFMSSPASNVALSAPQAQPSNGSALFPAPVTTTSTTDATGIEEDGMEEEAPEPTQTPELNLGGFGGFGIGSTANSAAPKSNPFGNAFGNPASSSASSSFSMAVPSGELFKPASFSFVSPQPSQPSQPTGFGPGTAAQAPAPGGFGKPAQVGAGQQALGSVLGTFGQSRQIGTGLPGSGFAPASSFGSGFASPPSTGGFSSAATGGGFAALASGGGGGFAAMASQAQSGGFGAAAAPGGGGFAAAAGGGGGGFAAMASQSGGFGGAAAPGGGGFAAAGGGFAGAGSTGGGFGGFSGQQGSGGGFSAFSGNNKPPELFTQIRK